MSDYPKNSRGQCLGDDDGDGNCAWHPDGCPRPADGLDPLIEAACEVMHIAYEDAAAEEGWETQQASRKPWSEVPEANKATMRVAVKALVDFLHPEFVHEATAHPISSPGSGLEGLAQDVHSYVRCQRVIPQPEFCGRGHHPECTAADESEDRIEIDMSDMDIVHLPVGDGCVVSVNGQGHLPCYEHHTEGG